MGFRVSSPSLDRDSLSWLSKTRHRWPVGWLENRKSGDKIGKFLKTKLLAATDSSLEGEITSGLLGRSFISYKIIELKAFH
ncbi:hypothetical protein AXF42_Ash017422 [Apostasia shenzhenica]|uniref:Uncharacterized protein n=1 Tax=Apostasia shenzhenica TaxID=1088818 RepID=A0A2H9ZZ00_9ASPA|nr:hypothetical protein AXF42_Ash017422 [Apostasia shenzhenica]